MATDPRRGVGGEPGERAGTEDAGEGAVRRGPAAHDEHRSAAAVQDGGQAGPGAGQLPASAGRRGAHERESNSVTGVWLPLLDAQKKAQACLFGLSRDVA